MQDLSSVRSLLFVPGNDERKLKKALATDADAVVVDLEDAVPASEKRAARSLVSDVLSETTTSSLVAVRLNGVGTPFWEDDIRAVAALEIGALMLPKALPQGVAELGVHGPPVLAIIETAWGLKRAFETASNPRVAALVLGAVDLGLELGFERRPDGQEVLLARSQLVLDSAAARIRAPFDQVFVHMGKDKAFEAECQLGRSLGFRGKGCIHPTQVEIVNRVFSPSVSEVAHAQRVVNAYEQAVQKGQGALSLDGEMIDLPVFERARRVLADAQART
jgi:citrate lyase beta subunit